MNQLACKSCGRQFMPPRGGCYRHCAECRSKIKAYSPAVYRWVAPDGRSYIGSTVHSFTRPAAGLDRKNRRIDAALKEYPPETWAYEVLERLDPGCPEAELRLAESETSEPASEPEPDTEPLPQKIVTRDELMVVVAQIMALPDMYLHGEAFDVVLSGDVDGLELYDALNAAADRLDSWRYEIGQHEIDGKRIWELVCDRQVATKQAERDRLAAEEAERKAAAKAERKREREFEKLIRQQDKDLAKAAAKAAPPADDDNLDIRKQPFARRTP
jgi:hypothetical protein